jgi:hypothetical protein
MDNYITIREASLLSGKSISYIRKIVRDIYSKSTHEDSLKGVIRREKVSENPLVQPIYLIKKEFVDTNIRDKKESFYYPHKTTETTSQEDSQKNDQNMVIEILKKQLEIKDEQIRDYKEQNNKLMYMVYQINAPKREENNDIDSKTV